MFRIQDFEQLGNEVQGLPVLLIGDAILDKYISGQVSRISPESPVPILLQDRIRFVLGGAANVALNLHGLGMKVTFLTRLGTDESSIHARNELADKGIILETYSQDHEIAVKTRFLARGTQMLRVDHEKVGPNSEKDLARFAEKVSRLSREEFKAVLVSDYDKGVIDGKSWRIINTGFSDIPIVVDPKKRDLGFYVGATTIKPNAKEASEYLDFCRKESNLDLKSLQFISMKTNITKIAVTLGDEGVLFTDSSSGEIGKANTSKDKLVDVTGAGDAFISVLVAAEIAKWKFSVACELATKVATWTCSFSGTKPIKLNEMVESLRSAQKEMVDYDKTSIALFMANREGKKVVFTNGCFDVLHVGHLQLLEFAKKAGDVLVVGINSDESIRRLKGDDRPINTLADRMKLLSSLSVVDFVLSFSEDTPLKMIETLVPDVLIKGSEYSESEIVGSEFLRSRGGVVLTFPMHPGTSSTSIIKKMGL